MRQASQQSRREFSPAVSPTSAGDVSRPAYAKSSEIRFDPFISVQPLQSRKAFLLPFKLQEETRRRASRVARVGRCLRPARPRKRRLVRVSLTPPLGSMEAVCTENMHCSDQAPKILGGHEAGANFIALTIWQAATFEHFGTTRTRSHALRCRAYADDRFTQPDSCCAGAPWWLREPQVRTDRNELQSKHGFCDLGVQRKPSRHGNSL